MIVSLVSRRSWHENVPAFVLVLCGLLFASRPVFAAQLSFGASARTVGLAQQVKLNVYLDSQGEDVNAVEGTVTFPAHALKFKSVSDGGSIVAFWAQAPAAGSAGVRFAGIVPGGFSGSKGFLFSLTFETQATGQAVLAVMNDRVLLNDGHGTATKVSLIPLTLAISAAIVAPAPAPAAPPPDIAPPEAFSPTISRTADLFGNQWFVVFATQDKGSGIDHYDLQESTSSTPSPTAWQTVQSPYLLKDQSLGSYIFIRAVDKAGNERVAFVTPAHPGVLPASALPPQAPPKQQASWEFLLAVLIAAVLLPALVLWRAGNAFRRKR